MSNRFWLLGVCIFLCMNSLLIAGETGIKYNLSTPDDTVQSFFMAAKKGDFIGLEKILSSDIKDRLNEKKFPLKEYVKAWISYPVIKISKAKRIRFKDDRQKYASADIVISVNGKEHGSNVSLIKENGQWLWDEW